MGVILLICGSWPGLTMNTERLRELISLYPGESWDNQVSRFAEENGRSRSRVYHWLSKGAPPNVLDAIEFRLTKELESD